MKVLHICSSIKGGAGIACERIHAGLLKEGIDSSLITADTVKSRYPNSYRAVDLLSNSQRVLLEFKETFYKAKNKLKVQRLNIDSTLFSFLRSPYGFIVDSEIYKESDIVHLHWVANFLDYKSFFRKNKKPLVWTLHDMNPFFPGNHYTLREDEFENNKATISKLTKKKIDFLKNQTLGVAATTQWMLETSLESEIFGSFPHELIHYGFDTKIFKPQDKNFARTFLDIPLDKKVILFAVNNIFDKRKGFDLLLKAIENIEEKDAILCIMGSTYGVELPKNANIHNLGFIHDERLLSLVFSAADVFLTPAIEEAFGQTTIESLCCGTPVIGFDTGIIPEVIVNSKNGFICPNKTPDDLTIAIDTILKNLPSMDSSEISNSIRTAFKEKNQAKKYIELYKKVREPLT